MNELSSKLVEGVELMADAALNNSGLPKTIDCEIIELKDAATGLYTVRYMENEIEVYASSPTLQYDPGEMVSVLVPSGNLAKTKYIIGAAVPAGYMYSSLSSVSDDESDGRIVQDGNIFTLSDIALCSFTPTNNEINITDSFSIELFRKNIEAGNRNFTFTFKIKTNLPQEQKRSGNYGLVFKIPVLLPSDTAESETVESWISASLTAVDAQRGLQGRVYDFTEYTLQSQDFEVPANAIYDGTRYPKLVEIVEDFIEKEDMPDDIFFKDIAVKGVTYLPLAENDGNYLAIVPTETEFFTENQSWSSTKTLIPLLKLHGKDKDVKGYDCYWYVEDCRIKKLDDEGYETHGGFGWRCLNDKKITQTEEDGSEGFQWVTNVYTLEVKKEDVYTSLTYKCVLVQKDFSISGKIALKNLQPLYETKLSTVEGPVTFSPNHGKIHMAARIKRTNDEYPETITISTEWQRFDKNGNLIDEPDGVPEIGDINAKESHIENDEEVIDWLRSTVAYPCSLVHETNLIRCTFIEKKVDDNGVITTRVIGTEQLSVYTTKEYDYRINIINDRYVYNYDADGDSPMVAQYDGPASSVVKQINPISFSIFKKDGSELTDEDYTFCEVTWAIPKDSMILKVGSESRSDNEYYYFDYHGRLGSDLYYNILNPFNVKKAYNNTIILHVRYKDFDKKESINLIFTKDGKSGTNGTKFNAVITYNGHAYEEVSQDSLGRTIKNKFTPTMIMQKDYMGGWTTRWGIYHPIVDDDERIYNRIEDWYYSNNRTLELKLYKDGQLIENPEGVYSVSWSILDYSNCNAFFTIDQNGRVSNNDYWYPGDVDDPNITGKSYPIISSSDPCHIVKAEVTIFSNATDTTYQQKLYAFYPIDMFVIRVGQDQEWSFDDTEFNLLDVCGGYDEVMYAPDGTNPQYDNTSDFYWGGTFSRTKNDFSRYVASDTQYSTWGAYHTNNFIEKTVKADKTGYHARPAQKYTNGETKGLIGATAIINHNHYDSYSYWDEDLQETITVVDEVNDGIETDIDTVEQEIYDLQVEYNEDYIFKTNLETFQHELDNEQIFDYNNYIDDLENSQSMLSSRGYLFSYISGLLEKLTELNQYVEGKTVTFTPSLASAISDLEAARDYLLVLGNTGETTYAHIYENLHTSGATRISFNSALTQTLNGLSVRLKIQTYLQDINELLNTYFAEVRTLKTFTTDLAKFTSLKNRLKTYLNNNTALDGLTDNVSLGEDFRAYKTLVISMFNSLDSSCTGYEQIRKMLNDFKNEHMKFAQNYYTTKYNNILNNVLYLKQEKERYLLDLQGIAMYEDIRYYKSIHLYLNYYGLSHLNNWDGTKIYTDEDGQYILAPQFGAGKKEEDNKYTGLLMGIIKRPVTNGFVEQVGMLGKSHGEDTLFISAEDGSAIFGKSSPGQFIIDPTQNKALLYSHNYWNSYNTTNKERYGLPSNYNTSNISYKGMLINLTDSLIHFGNNVEIAHGSAITDAEQIGHLINSYFKSLDMTGFPLNDNNIKRLWNYSLSRDHVGFYIAVSPAGHVAIFGAAQIPEDPDDFYMSKTTSGSSTIFRYNPSSGLINTTVYGVVCWDYENGAWSARSNYISDHQRDNLSCTYDFTVDAQWLVEKNIPSIDYEIVTNGRLYSGRHTELKSTQDGFYLDNVGLSIGSKFKVKCTATGGTLLLGDGAVAESSGSKHWTVDSNSTGNSFIAYGTTSFSETSGVYLGTDGIRLGNTFKVTAAGALTAQSGDIAGWRIGSDVIYSPNGLVALYSSGRLLGPGWDLNSTGGTIGGWSIDGTLLSSGTGVTALTLNGGTGTISGPGFTLNSSGLNLTSGRLSLWNGTTAGLTWNGSALTIKGTITATAGNFGDWSITNDGLENTSHTVDNQPTKITPTAVIAETGRFKTLVLSQQAAEQGSITAGDGNFNHIYVIDHVHGTGTYVSLEQYLQDYGFLKKSDADTYYASATHTHHFHDSGNVTITVSGNTGEGGLDNHTHYFSKSGGSSITFDGNTGAPNSGT